jgi:hypothetical protein
VIVWHEPDQEPEIEQGPAPTHPFQGASAFPTRLSEPMPRQSLPRLM